MTDTATFVGSCVCKAELPLRVGGMSCPTYTEHLWSHGVMTGVEDGALSVREIMG